MKKVNIIKLIINKIKIKMIIKTNVKVKIIKRNFNFVILNFCDIVAFWSQSMILLVKYLLFSFNLK